MSHHGAKIRTTERGGMLFFIFLAVALLAMATWAVTKMERGTQGNTSSLQLDNQVQRLLAQGATLAGAVQQMVANGADPALLPTTAAATGLNTVIPGVAPPAGYANWDTPPHMLKIYHPYGGGVKYMSQVGEGAALSDTSNIANNFLISKGSIVKGVGATDVTGDILFTAVVFSAKACQRINTLLTGTATMPVVSNAAYTALFTNGTNTTLSVAGGTCIAGPPSCDNTPRACVQNVAGTGFGYYQVLLPQ